MTYAHYLKDIQTLIIIPSTLLKESLNIMVTKRKTVRVFVYE